jgi:hypothetical protein
VISDSLASVRFGSELRVEFNERRVEAVTSSMCDFEFRTPQASHGYCQQSYEHLKETEVGMPKARVPDRDEQHTRVCEVWGPAGSDGLLLDVGRLPSCLLGKLSQISTTSQRRPANIDTKWLDGTHTPHIMRMNGGCRAHR